MTTLANGGSPSTIGNSTNAAANLVLAGGTLRFSGAAAGATDRLFTVSANSTIDASGTGNATALLSFTNTGDIAWGSTGQARTLTLNAGTASSVNNLLSSRISDNGAGVVSLVKNGGGNWSLLGNNTFSGGITINGGFLRIGSTAATTATAGTGNITLNSGTLSVGRTNTYVMDNFISGNGTVHMNNTGVFVLTANNTYSGTPNVNANGGTIQMGNGGTSGSIGTSDVFINTGGTFRINRSDDVTIGGTITGAGNITKTGNGTLTLTNSFTNQLNVEQGTVSISSFAGSSFINLGSIGNNGRLIFTGAGSIGTGRRIDFAAGGGTIEVTEPDTTLSLNIGSQGAGSLTKEGPGTLNLSSGQVFYGDTIVNEGTLLFNTVKNSAGSLQINGNGTLGGTGNTTNSILSSGGTITPGATLGAVGTLTTAGAQDPFVTNSTLVIDLNGDSCDKLVITGNSTGFSTGAFNLVINATGAQTQASYVIVDSSAGVIETGPFLNVTGLPSGYIVGYSDNQLTITSGAASPFSDFMVATGLSGLDAEPTADPDADGFSNLEEFMFDGQPNPANSNSSTSPKGAPTQVLDATYLTITYGRSQTAMTQPGISVAVEYGSDLTGWTTAVNGGGINITEWIEPGQIGFGSENHSQGPYIRERATD